MRLATHCEYDREDAPNAFGFGPGLSSPAHYVSWLNYFRMDAVHVECRQSWQISTESDPHHVVRHDVAWESFEVVDAVWFVGWLAIVFVCYYLCGLCTALRLSDELVMGNKGR